jgi:hypothetical protein
MAESDPATAITFEQSFDQQIDVDMSTAVMEPPIDCSNVQDENLMTSAFVSPLISNSKLSLVGTYML